jgi:hypothetical protein
LPDRNLPHLGSKSNDVRHQGARGICAIVAVTREKVCTTLPRKPICLPVNAGERWRRKASSNRTTCCQGSENLSSIQFVRHDCVISPKDFISPKYGNPDLFQNAKSIWDRH